MIWILFSDQLVGILATSPQQFVQLSIAKGWGFVIVTTWFLYVLIKREFSIRRQREREIEAIARLSTATRLATSREEVLPVILDEILKFTSAETTAIILSDENIGDFQAVLVKGNYEEYTGFRIPAHSISGITLLSGKPYLNNHIQGDPDVYLPDSLGKITALAAAPLIVQQHKLGVMVMAKKGAFDQSEYRLLISVADITASAIYRLTLYDQSQLRVQQLSTLRSIDLAITSSLDLTSTLSILVDEVQKLKGISACCVLMPVEGSHQLHFRTGKGFTGAKIHQAALSEEDFKISSQFPARFTLTISDLKNTPSSSRYELGIAEDFKIYHAIPLISKDKIKGVLEVYQREDTPLDQEVLDFLEALATQAAIAVDVATLIEDLQSSNKELSAAYDSTIEGWSRALDLRDKETEGHTQRVTEMALHLARIVGMDADELIQLYRGALLHDIGKMGIPDSILLKPAPLTPEETEFMKMHPIYAYHLLKPIRFLHPALDIPYCHHERWDGSGYPRGLKGEQIPIAARIFTVVDVWDALVSERPYSPAWPKEDALKHIQQHSGTYFDPSVVDIFIRMMD
jgi:HD-GYP domain-containing protein (c-di-GMP phosphodiesterase class II)